MIDNPRLLLAHKLVANGIGGKTVQELSDGMEVDEFLRWAAYTTIEPFGDDRADWRYAMLMALQANMNRGKKPPMPVHRFLLKFEATRKVKKSLRELEAVMYAQYLRMGGKPRE